MTLSERWSVQALVQRSYARPRVVLLGWAMGLVLAGLQWRHLEIDTTIGSALDRSGQPWANYERSLDLFGGDEFVTIALAPADAPFAEASLKEVLAISDLLEGLESVRRVDSLSTVPLIRSDEDGALQINPGLTVDVASSAAGRGRLAELVRRDAVVRKSLVSGDGTVFGVNVVFDDDVDGDRESVVAEIETSLAEFDGTVMSGVPVVRAEAGTLTRSEIGRLVPLTVAAVALVLIVAFGRARAAIPALAVGGIGAGGCLAAMALAGVPLSFSTAVLPSVILALSCAYSMHFLAAESRSGDREATESALREVAGPVALSGTTTALGFVSMATTSVSLIRDLAVFGAFGVVVSTIACLTIVPAVLSLRPPAGDRRPRIPRVIESEIGPRWTDLIVRHRRAVILFWFVIVGLCVVGLTHLHVSSDVIEWFPAEGELRRSHAEITERLSGITPVNVVVNPPEGMSAATPEMVQRIAGFSEALEAHPTVGKALSIAAPLAMMHRELGQGDGESVPRDPEVVAQYLALLDGVEQLDDVVTPSRDVANVLLRLDDNSSASILALADWAEIWWAEHGTPGSSVDVTGIMYEFARAQDEISWAGIRGAALALATIALLVMAYFRDLRFLLVAVVINAVPVAVILGVIGWMGIALDAATVCVASLAIGIAVDDTIHALAEVRSASPGSGGAEDPVRFGLPRVMSPLILSTVAIASGFGVLATSSIALVSGLGLAMCAAVVACLLADLSLLPSLLAADPQQRRN